LHDYANDVISQSFTVDLDEIREWQLIGEPVRPVGRAVRLEKVQSRPWLIALASAAAVLVLIGSVALAFQLSGSDTPAATAAATESHSLSEWSRVPADEAVFGGAGDQWMESVTVGGPGLVAVGLDQARHYGDGDAGEGHAAVWTSADGITWSRVPHDEEIFGGLGEEFMTSVIAGGPGLVAVGWDLGRYSADAAVWTSPDGLTWSRVPDDEGVFGGSSHQAMWGVTAGGPGLVAVGEDRSRDREDGDVAVWTSADGITWSRVPHDQENLGTGQVTSVTTADSGLLVAVGNEGNMESGGSGDDAAVWTSIDGITWSRVPHDDAVFGEAVMQSVTAGGPGLVAVGTSGLEDDRHAAVWTSVDGITWSRVPHDEAVFGRAGDQWMEGVTASLNGMVAVGGADSEDGADAAVWTSTDGIIWTRTPDDSAIFTDAGMSSVVFGGSSAIAVGGDDGTAAVWNASTDD
jgi:hypothetical protein